MDNQDHKAFLKAFAENLKRLRKERQLTQAALAIDADLSESQIQRIEYAQYDFKISTLLALAKALKVEPSDLLLCR